MASSPTISWQIMGRKWKQWQIFFSWIPKSLLMVTAAMRLKEACSSVTNLDRVLKRHIALLTKVHMVKGIFFSVVIFGRESRVIEEAKKSWFFWIVVLGCHSCIESPLGSKEIKPINPKGSQPWIFIERTDGEAEAPILWPPDEKSWLIGKDPDAGRDWRQEEKGMTEDETVGYHHWLNGCEFEQTPGNSEGQGSLVWFSPWGCKESDTA